METSEPENEQPSCEEILKNYDPREPSSIEFETAESLPDPEELARLEADSLNP
jgi:hypothetical protein